MPTIWRLPVSYTHLDVYKRQRSFLDNPLGQINAKYGDKGMVVSGDVKFADASTVDLIETDYHNK